MRLEELEKELEETKLVKERVKVEARPSPETYEKVVRFANEVRKKYGDLIKSVMIFGSAARGKLKPGSDIDVWVVLDDTSTKSSEEFERITAHLYLIARELKDIHIQTTPLTQFWQWIRIGSPELINFLRYGLPIYDTGFIKPVQRMLQSGLIPPSKETIRLKAAAATARLKKIGLDLKSMIFDLRYSVLDICQAVAMHFYKEQPDAAAMPGIFKKLMEEKGLEAEWIEKFERLDRLWKDIEHERIKDVGIDHLKEAHELASSLIERFKKFLPEVES
jgi:predicted nucleotidyltransferase